MNQSKLELHVSDEKRGKTCANESQLVCLHLIGLKSGAGLLSLSCFVVDVKSLIFRRSDENRSVLS